MQFDNQKTRNVADAAAKIMAGESAEKVEQPEMLEEELKGNQHKIDANKNGKVDADDFAKLRAQKEKEKSNSMKFGKDVKEETEQVDEAMFPGTKEYQKKYGQSPQQKLKKVGDKEKTSSGEMEKTAGGVKHTRRFSEMLDAYKQNGLKSLSEMMVKEEPSNDEYTSELEDQKSKASGKKKQPDLTKGYVQAVQQEEVEQIDEEYTLHKTKDDGEGYVQHDVHYKGKKIGHIYADGYGNHGYEYKARGTGDDKYQTKSAALASLKSDHKHDMSLKKEETEQIEEREMTDAEMKKREEIVKSMKKGMAGFKQRYGDRAKSVMYATATKQAMKEENDEESI